jgi:hypothetical protein
MNPTGSMSLFFLRRYSDFVGLKTIYSAVLSCKMKQPFYQLNALPKSFLTLTEIMHFEW